MGYDKNEILNYVFNASQYGILFCDEKGIIKLWNKGCKKIFEYTEDEAINKSLDIIIPENLRNKHWNGFYKAIKSKKIKYGESLLSVPAIRKDGNRISIECSINMIFKHESVIGLLAVVKDATETWNKEKELKNKIKELEDKLKNA